MKQEGSAEQHMQPIKNFEMNAPISLGTAWNGIVGTGH